MLSSITILIVFSSVLLTETNGQILNRQSISDSQQMQIPIRRINIPVDLKKRLNFNDQRTDVKTPMDSNCPQCLEKRLVQHYMMRGCTPVIKGGCECPSRYQCPTNERIVDKTLDSYRKSKSLDTDSCKFIDCSLRFDTKLEMGCTPVYSDKSCCPLRYICPKRNNLRIRGVENGSLLCEFEGRKYAVGSHLYSDDNCSDCVCRIPPQFTCIQRKSCL